MLNIIDLSYNYFFIHIPKCAGNSIINFFTSKDYKSVVLHNGPSNFNDEILQSLKIVEKSSQKLIISGHISLDEVIKYTNDKPQYKIITTIRDPIERVISTYNYWSGNCPLDPESYEKTFLSFNDFIFSTHPRIINEIHNRMCYQLSYAYLKSSKREFNNRSYYDITNRKNINDVYDKALKNLENVLIIFDISNIPVYNKSSNNLFGELNDNENNRIKQIIKYDIELYNKIIEKKDIFYILPTI